ncbi:MAG: hypothetical protein WDZ60_01165, partial [Wenzhouxiangellaceae bacterium]
MKLFHITATVHAARWLSAAVLLPLLFAVGGPVQSASSEILGEDPAGRSGLQAATPPLLWERYPTAIPSSWQQPSSAHPSSWQSHLRSQTPPALAMLDSASHPDALRQPVAFTATNPVADKRGAGGVWSEAGQPPEFVSTPPATVRVGRRYEYQAEAISEEDLPLTFSLATAPRRMRVDADTGLVEWRPAAPPGEHEVELVVRDEAGAEARQAWTLRVLRPNEQVEQPP